MKPKDLEKQSVATYLAYLDNPNIEIQYCSKQCYNIENNWEDFIGHNNNLAWSIGNTYYRIKPKQVNFPLTKEDFKGVWFVTYQQGLPSKWSIVEGVDSEGIHTDGVWRSFKYLVSNTWQRSKDLINWEPCYKEVTETSDLKDH